jgi:hypothetical protein
MSSEPDLGTGKGFVAQVVGNSSLLTAVLIYMGWAYENSLLTHFQVSALSLSIGTAEYVLKGLVPLFQSHAVFGAAVIVVVLTLVPHGATSARRFLPRQIPGPLSLISKHRLMLGGIVLVAVTVPLAWLGEPTDSPGMFWILLALLGAGCLITAWPARRGNPGSFTYPLAVVVAAICTLWVAGDYAGNLGTSAAISFARSLANRTAVTVYSAQSLAISGPGVNCKPTTPAAQYHYRCTGLRLLYAQSGTYYLLPAGWAGPQSPTYILDDSNQVRIELSAAGLLVVDAVRLGEALDLERRMLERVEKGHRHPQAERQHRVDERAADDQQASQDTRDEPGTGRPAPVRRHLRHRPSLPQRPFQQQEEADRHPLEHHPVQRGGEPRVESAHRQVVRQHPRRYRDQHHEHQQDEVEEQQGPGDDHDVGEQRVVVHPDGADRVEADQVGDEGLPLVDELMDERPVARPGDREVEREQRDRDGQHGVAKYLKPAPVHARPARKTGHIAYLISSFRFRALSCVSPSAMVLIVQTAEVGEYLTCGKISWTPQCPLGTRVAERGRRGTPLESGCAR